MSPTPRNMVTLSRVALLLLVPGSVATFIGPFQAFGALAHVGPTLLHALTFYAVVAVAFVAFPKLRRSDMCMIAVVMGGLIEMAQLMSGHGAHFGYWLADCAGVVALYAPGKIERLRHLARKHAFTSFSDLSARDRRKSAKRKTATMDHFPADTKAWTATPQA